ncbi:MAG: hypothetical protein JWL73_577 [Actinomycetia bacterium]|nr:hypothetical protein [Actinomycetes bacterium]
MVAVLEPKTESSRSGGWMGIGFFVLFVAGFLTFTTPDDAKNTAKWARWWTDSGHRVAAVIGTFLIILGLLAFVWFAASLQRWLGGAGHVAGTMLVTFATLFVAAAGVSTMLRAAIPGGKLFGDTPVPAGADLARQFDNAGFAILLIAGALAAGAFVITASYLARVTGALPNWLIIAGFIVGVLQIAAGLFFPFLLFLLWVLAVSIVLVRARPEVVVLEVDVVPTV